MDTDSRIFCVQQSIFKQIQVTSLVYNKIPLKAKIMQIIAFLTYKTNGILSLSNKTSKHIE